MIDWERQEEAGEKWITPSPPLDHAVQTGRQRAAEEYHPYPAGLNEKKQQLEQTARSRTTKKPRARTRDYTITYYYY